MSSPDDTGRAAIFAHGFEGHPQGQKARYLRDRLDYRVIAPSMHRFGWSFTGHVRSVLTALDENPHAALILGSSMGGLAVATALASRPERAIHAILMAPAFGIHRVWAASLGLEAMAHWQTTGYVSYPHGGVGRTIELPYAFFTACRDAAEVSMIHPCVVIHGRNDEVVPFHESEKLLARSNQPCGLLASDDGHRLGNSLQLIDHALQILGSQTGDGTD